MNQHTVSCVAVFVATLDVNSIDGPDDIPQYFCF